MCFSQRVCDGTKAAQARVSYSVVREEGSITAVANLTGRIVAVGAVDSPQVTLLPLAHLHTLGLDPGSDLIVQHHNVLVGKHGDHIGGEREAAHALVTGSASAAGLLEQNYHQFLLDGTLLAGSTHILTRTPAFDHCNFTVVSPEPSNVLDDFQALLIDMSYDDPEVRPSCDLEGLQAWYTGRIEGYRALGIPDEDHIIRPLVRRGFSAQGIALSLPALESEVTVNCEGVYWHPVATDPDLLISPQIFPCDLRWSTLKSCASRSCWSPVARPASFAEGEIWALRVSASVPQSMVPSATPWRSASQMEKRTSFERARGTGFVEHATGAMQGASAL